MESQHGFALHQMGSPMFPSHKVTCNGFQVLDNDTSFNWEWLCQIVKLIIWNVVSIFKKILSSFCKEKENIEILFDLANAHSLINAPLEINVIENGPDINNDIDMGN